MIKAFACLFIIVSTQQVTAQQIKCDRYGCRPSAKAHHVTHSGRPAGCPHRFCGCALSIKLFGRIVPKLNLAWNWAREFPRVRYPHAELVAVRRHHVMQLLSHVRDDLWRVYDPNSGGGLIRIHVRSVRGFVFVDPARRLAGI